MQRLFSMFPTGAAGIALFLLRFSAAAVLLFLSARHPTPSWAVLVPALPATALFLGLATPYASGMGCLLELETAIQFADQPVFPIIISIVTTAALGVLGPGAYSLDARIFGRRIVNFSTRDKLGPS